MSRHTHRSPSLIPHSTPGADLTDELKQVMLIGLSPSIAAHLMPPIRSVAPGAELRAIGPADLDPLAITESTLLIVQDRTAEADGLEIVRRLRVAGTATPALLVVTNDDFQCPSDLEQLGDLDVIPLAELSRFALRRCLVLLSSRRSRETLLEEVAGKVRAYERLLAAKDEERQRVLDVATALECRLSATEKQFQSAESEWAEKISRGDAYATKLEERLADFHTGTESGQDGKQRVKAEEDARRRQHALELAFLRDQRIQQEQVLTELRRTCAVQEQELGQQQAQQDQIAEMSTRLQASEGVRGSQTQMIQVYQQRIKEAEQHLATIAALLQAEQGTDPSALLEQLAGRLAQVESVRSEQQGTIDRLSHTLAEQQIDNALDKRPARRDIVAQVDESVERSHRLGTPLNCLMIGIDEPERLRSELGSISYDFMQVQIAQRLQLSARRGDLLMRYGDGEFVLMADAKTAAEARSHAERLIREVCATPLELGDCRLELSISVAVLPYYRDAGGAHELLRRAKGTLLEAQARGPRQTLVGNASPGPVPVQPQGVPRRVPFS